MNKGEKIQGLLDNKPLSREEYYQAVEEFHKAIDTQASILQRRGLWIQRLIAIIGVLVSFNIVYFLFIDK
mgnify:CR=1 FL=1